ncbi:undecaprenyl-diphosphatase UppP [Candidatus Curtissbacteria bacterium]|nr:undecaprenyl-diphosphatase UppP [Candidatus Curtissbacteria bacterium]
MNYLLAGFAGMVQGLTEFLPVSSTGHLIIYEHIFGIPADKFGLSFDASLHLGTLAAVVLFFYKDYLRALKSKLAVAILVGTIPAAALGLILETAIESSFRQLWVVGTALILFSFVIVAAEKIGAKNQLKDQITPLKALVVGAFQALALVPGISRSGATISAGLLLGLAREEAAKFAFMLSGPIILAAGLKKFIESANSSQVSAPDFNLFAVGIVSSAVAGYLTIKYFLKYLSTRTLYPFVIYRIILGIILIVQG